MIEIILIIGIVIAYFLGDSNGSKRQARSHNLQIERNWRDLLKQLNANLDYQKQILESDPKNKEVREMVLKIEGAIESNSKILEMTEKFNRDTDFGTKI